MKKVIVVMVLLLVISVGLFAADVAKYYITIRNTDMGRLLKSINKKVEEGYIVSGGITQAIDSPSWSNTATLYYYVLMYDSKLIQL